MLIILNDNGSYYLITMSACDSAVRNKNGLQAGRFYWYLAKTKNYFLVDLLLSTMVALARKSVIIFSTWR